MPTPFAAGTPFAARTLTAALTLALSACSGDGAGITPGELFEHPESIGEGALQVMGTSSNLAQVVDLAVAPDGTVWLLNAAPPFFVAFDAAGREVAVGGQRGGGPGEFGQPTALVRLDSGIWSWDTRRGALAKVSGADGLSAGSAMLSIPVREPSGAPMRTAVFSEMLLVDARAWVGGRGNEAVLARIPSSTWGNAHYLWEAEFMAVNVTAAVTAGAAGAAGTARSGASEAQPVALFASKPHLASPEEKYPGAELFLPLPLWSQCPDGSMAAYDPVRNALVRVDGSGDPLGSVSLPPAREIQATPDRLFEDLAPHMLASMPSGQAPPVEEMRADFVREFEEVRSQLSRVMPEYRELACTGGSARASSLHAWLQLLEIGRSGNAAGGRWLRVSLSGDAEGGDAESRVFQMPDSFRPLHFLDGVAWGVSYDDFEVPYLARLGLPE
jgi:hypothetical protein